MVGERQLLDALSGNAFRASNGDYAWRRVDLLNVVESLTGGHYAIISGEVWVVEGNLFCPLSPAKTGGWALLAWESPEREDEEPWDHFAHRTAEETLQAVHALNPEERVPADVADKLFYHVCIADEASYQPPTHAIA
jgi:hypothetical protein